MKKLKNSTEKIGAPRAKPIWLISNDELISVSNASCIKVVGAKLVFAYSTAGVEVVMSSAEAAKQTFRYIARLIFEQNTLLAEVAPDKEKAEPSAVPQ